MRERTEGRGEDGGRLKGRARRAGRVLCCAHTDAAPVASFGLWKSRDTQANSGEKNKKGRIL